MDHFDEEGKLKIPDKDAIVNELEKRGVECEKNLHVKQVYCPNGHEMIMPDNAKFDGMPGIKLFLKGENKEEIVYISPFLNKRHRTGGDDFGLGDKLEVRCPVCDVKMPVIGPCDCQWNGEYVMLSLDKDATNRNAVCFCDIWGCPKGDVRLAGEVVSEYIRDYRL